MKLNILIVRGLIRENDNLMTVNDVPSDLEADCRVLFNDVNVWLAGKQTPSEIAKYLDTARTVLMSFRVKRIRPASAALEVLCTLLEEHLNHPPERPTFGALMDALDKVLATQRRVGEVNGQGYDDHSDFDRDCAARANTVNYNAMNILLQEAAGLSAKRPHV